MPYLYENKRKNENKKAIIVTAVFIVLLVLGYFIYNYFTSREYEDEESYFSVCSLDYKSSKNLLLNEEFKNEFEIKDYLYYGEYLNLYHDTYSIFNKDVLTGKTITLKDLCTNMEYTYMNAGYVDGQIPVETLDDGFYGIYISYENALRRAYSVEEIYDEFYTVRRNNSAKKVTLIAKRSILDNDKETNLLAKNYLYLLVETVNEIPEEYYDVVIDPAYAYDVGDYVEKGGIFNELNETEETFKAANEIKNILEAKGLKVLVTRSLATELIPTYGEGSRLEKAYQSKSKYFIELQMNSASSSKQKGMQVTYSSFATNKMAVSIKNTLNAETFLTPKSNSGKNSIDGISKNVISNGYDGMMIIRETGGKALNAATYSEKAQQNQIFALDNRYGMHTVSISYMYITNAEEANYWKGNYLEIAKATANAILNYLQIEDVTTN